MSLLNLTSSEFYSLIDEIEIIFIYFWAAWCAPCNQFSKVYEQVAHQFPYIQFAKVNIEVEQQLADLFEVRSIPHLIIFKEGIVIYSNAGSLPASTIKELVEQSVAVDVSPIREIVAIDK